jgi:hypothetical protein
MRMMTEPTAHPLNRVGVPLFWPIRWRREATTAELIL